MSPPGDEIGSWQENRKLVLSEITRCATNIHELRNAVNNGNLKTAEQLTMIRADIAGLKTHARYWGAVAAFIVAPIAVVVVEILARLIFKP